MASGHSSIGGDRTATSVVIAVARRLWLIAFIGVIGVGVMGVGGRAGYGAAPLSCPLSHEGLWTGGGLPRVAAKLQRHEPLRVVAIGSSSTEGVGASSRYANYPAWFGRALAHVFPDSDLMVFNRGIGGQRAGQMLERFEQDVLALSPDMVLWQTGTIEALESDDLQAFAATVRQGLAVLRGHGIDVMLVGQQFSPKLEAAHPDYRRYVDGLRTLARTENVALLDRYVAMQRWAATAAGGPIALMSADNLHMKDDSYRCFGVAVATAVSCVAGKDCPAR